MKHNLDPIDEQLLHSYLRGEIDDKGIKDVEVWLDASIENVSVLKSYCLLDYAVKVISHSDEAEILASLHEVKTKIRKNQTHRLFVSLQRIAAILFIPVLAALFFVYRNFSKEDQPQYIEINSTQGSLTSLYLPDSTKVWLNSNSYIKYPAHFSAKSRNVEVRGEAYFAVSKDKDKPFLVKVNNEYLVKVLGTEFNIEAFSNESVFSTTLVKGSVQLISINDEKSVLMQMLPNEQVNWNRDSKTLDKKTVNTLNYTSWKDGKIIFKDHPINEILETLSRCYNVDFVIKNPQIMNQRFTGTFTNQKLGQILECFRLSIGINYKISQQVVKSNETERKTIVTLN